MRYTNFWHHTLNCASAPPVMHVESLRLEKPMQLRKNSNSRCAAGKYKFTSSPVHRCGLYWHKKIRPFKITKKKNSWIHSEIRFGATVRTFGLQQKMMSRQEFLFAQVWSTCFIGKNLSKDTVSSSFFFFLPYLTPYLKLASAYSQQTVFFESCTYVWRVLTNEHLPTTPTKCGQKWSVAGNTSGVRRQLAVDESSSPSVMHVSQRLHPSAL